jgi:hypothetical protein
MNKRLLVSLLTAAMVLGSTFTVLAGEPKTIDHITTDTETTNEITQKADIEKPVISVTIGATRGKMLANPYGLDIGATFTDLDAANATKTFVGDNYTISNNSNIPLAVGVKGTIKLGTGSALKVVSEEPATDTLGKYNQVYVYGIVANKDATNFMTDAGVGTKSAALPVVYSTKGTKLTKDPILAKGDPVDPSDASKGYKAVDAGVIQVIVDGMTTYSESAGWDSTKDKFDVITRFDIKGTNGAATFGS